jgi:hypothetical protein
MPCSPMIAGPRWARWGLLLALVTGISLLCANRAHAAVLETGFFDAKPLVADDGATWRQDARDVGGTVIRISVYWSTVAPGGRPAGFAPADPADPAYRWTDLDRQVRELTGEGFDVLLTVLGAPNWAQGPDRPSTARNGTWKPDPDQLAAFLQAAATRYSGTYPDPLDATTMLPRIRRWQVWNEPNLARYLSPQWESGSTFAPGWFRRLLNAGYDAIKSVQPDATVVAGGLAPFGDPDPGGTRIPPVRFLRDVLCLNTRLDRDCTATTSFDAFDHHPYGVASPTKKAIAADDAVVPDVYKLTQIVERAVKVGTAVPVGPKPAWVTEIAYDTNPPDPTGVSLAKQAAWLEQSMALLWNQGVRLMLWFSVVDQAPTPSYASTYQSGLYFLDGRAKPSATAFAFPLARVGSLVWTRAPANGAVVIERRQSKRWVVAARVNAQAGQVVQTRVTGAANIQLRARQGARTSLIWPVR